MVPKTFEIIISSFNNGDKKTSKNLVSNDVYSALKKLLMKNKQSRITILFTYCKSIADAK